MKTLCIGCFQVNYLVCHFIDPVTADNFSAAFVGRKWPKSFKLFKNKTS